MPQQQNGDSNSDLQDADFTKAFQELARGEQTATNMENQLSALEAKIDELLAAANMQQQQPSSASSDSTSQNPPRQSNQ